MAVALVVAVALEAEEVAVLMAEDLVVQVVVEEQPEVSDYLMNEIKKISSSLLHSDLALTLQNEICTRNFKFSVHQPTKGMVTSYKIMLCI